MASLALDQLPFTIQNLPYGIISTNDEPVPRCAVAIGKHAVDLVKYAKEGRLAEIEHCLDFEEMFARVCLYKYFQQSLTHAIASVIFECVRGSPVVCEKGCSSSASS